jgi:DNA-binding FadR family transcriptional regulator
MMSDSTTDLFKRIAQPRAYKYIVPLVTAGRTELIDRQSDWGLAIERIGYSHAVPEHLRIVDGVGSGDPGAAERAIETYLNWR